jgi:uncharacterized membrane protein YcaP (DUF421 family)
MNNFFFHDWTELLRTAVGTTITYAVLVFLLRVAGQRTLAKWYAFDLIVTVALGSTFANGVLSKNISIAQALVGFVVLVGLQFSIAWIIVRVPRIRSVVNPPPKALLVSGKFLRDEMRRNRVTEADVRSAIRNQGESEIEGIGAVILEPDGTFTVIKDLHGSTMSALKDVVGLK